MKRITLLLLLLVSALQAQPILNASNFPTEFSKMGYRANTAGFSNGSAGANQIWDFSAMILEQRNYTMTLIPITSMPFHELFPSANFCEKWNDNGLISYSVYNLNSTSFESLGYVDGNTVVQYTDTALILQFPYTYNAIINDTFLSNIPDATSHSQIRTYDAYGTLITPFGAFTDVVRVKLEGEQSISYIWIDSNTNQVLLGGNFENNVVYFFKDITNLTVNSSESQIFSIYPNPTQNDFILHNTNNFNTDVFVSVYDILGKELVSSIKANGNFNNISLKDFSPGLYIVKITNEENQVLHTEKIIKK